MALFDWLNPLRNLHQEINPRWQSLRWRILNDPYYRFQSSEEIAVAASLGVKIDANQATVDDWLRLPGLSIHQARSLVELNQLGVRFYCLEDIAAALGVSVARLTPLEPILNFCYYDTDSIYTIQRVNPNTASVEILSKIPALDPYLAQAIVQNRMDAGFYKNLPDLQRRLSLSAEFISQLMHYLHF